MLGHTFPTANAPFAFLDLEMSGLEPLQHEILEIAIVRVEQPSLTVLEEWSTKVRPEHIETADPVSLQMIGWSEEGWKDALPLAEAMRLFTEKTAHHIVAGWNVAYDWAFLEVAMAKTGTRTQIHKRILDVMSYAYSKLDDAFSLSDFGLAKMAKHLQIDLTDHHQALADTKATFEVYKKLAAQSST